jgi:hypothetical protein
MPTPENIKLHIWPAFLREYALGQDNVASLYIEDCDRALAGALVSTLEACGGTVLRSGNDSRDMSLEEVVRSTAPEDEPIHGSIMWRGRLYWFLGCPGDDERSVDLEWIYKDERPLLEPGGTQEMWFGAFMSFLSLGYVTYDAGGARALRIADAIVVAERTSS